MSRDTAVMYRVQASIRSRLLLQPAQIRAQDHINHIPEAPVCARFVVVEGAVFAEHGSVADDVAGEPAQDGN